MERSESRSVAAPVEIVLTTLAQTLGRSGTHDVEQLSATSLRVAPRRVPGAAAPGRLDNAIVVAVPGADGRSTITVAGRFDAAVLAQIEHALVLAERQHAAAAGSVAEVPQPQPRFSLPPPDPRDRLPDDAAPAPPVAAPEPVDSSETVALSRTTTAMLRLDTGVTVEIDQRGAVLGRDPRPAESSRPDVQLVIVEDANRLVSRSHVALRLVGSMLLVQDLGSVNGSAVVSADGRGEPLQPGRPVELTPGSRLRFGGCFADRIS